MSFQESKIPFSYKDGSRREQRISSSGSYISRTDSEEKLALQRLP